MNNLRPAWACQECDEHGHGDKADRDAEKHTKTTQHSTVTHLCACQSEDACEECGTCTRCESPSPCEHRATCADHWPGDCSPCQDAQDAGVWA